MTRCRLPACSWQKTPKGGPMLVAGDKRVRGRGCPILGADWERRSCASYGQMPSDTASGRQVNASDVRKCPRAGVLLALSLSSGRRGRRFKSGHPDQLRYLFRMLVRQHYGR